MIEVDVRVDSNFGAGVVDAAIDCAILVGCDGGKMDHSEVVTSHELDVHALPCRRRVLVSIPGDGTGRASVEHLARAGLTGSHFSLCDASESECGDEGGN